MDLTLRGNELCGQEQAAVRCSMCNQNIPFPHTAGSRADGWREHLHVLNGQAYILQDHLCGDRHGYIVKLWFPIQTH